MYQIRSTCAEELYLQLSEITDEIDPELESLLLETEWSGEGTADNCEAVINLLKSQLNQTSRMAI